MNKEKLDRAIEVGKQIIEQLGEIAAPIFHCFTADGKSYVIASDGSVDHKTSLMIIKLQMMRLGIIEYVVLSEGWAIGGNIEDRDKVNALIKEHGCIRDTPGRIDVLFATYVTHDGIAMKSFEEVKHGNKVADYIPRQDHECSGETEFGGDYVTLLPPRGFDIKSIPESGLEMIDSFLSRHSKTTMKGDF